MEEEKLSFVDYCNLMEAITGKGEKPTVNITRHNHDKLTYWDAYMYNKGIHEYVQAVNEYNLSLLGDLLSVLQYHKVLTAKDVEDMQRHTREKLRGEN